MSQPPLLKSKFILTTDFIFHFISLTHYSHLHSVLPANGAPVSRERTGRVKEMYNDYVRFRTQESWKFWIVSVAKCSFIVWRNFQILIFFTKNLQLGLIFKPLFESFNSTVSVASMEELSRTAILWVDQHCSLIEMRPGKFFFCILYASTGVIFITEKHSQLSRISWDICQQPLIFFQRHHRHCKTKWWKPFRSR